MAAHSLQVSNLVTIPGIVISTSRVKAKATSVFAQCKACQTVKQVPVRSGFAGAQLPRVCDRVRQPNEPPCGVDPYVVLPDKHGSGCTSSATLCLVGCGQLRSRGRVAMVSYATSYIPRDQLRKAAPYRCTYVDQQTWKLQEAPETVPTGEMPRSIMMTVDRHLAVAASRTEVPVGRVGRAPDGLEDSTQCGPSVIDWLSGGPR